MVVSTNSGKKLSSIAKGEGGFISHFSDQYVASKFLMMGILPGTRMEIVRRAPFGGGCYVKVDNHFLALRKQEARCIIMR